MRKQRECAKLISLNWTLIWLNMFILARETVKECISKACKHLYFCARCPDGV